MALVCPPGTVGGVDVRGSAPGTRETDLLDPVNLLRRGWSITRDADGNVVTSVADVALGSTIVTQVADGRLTSRIEEP